MARCNTEQREFIKSGFMVWRIPLLTLFFNAWFYTNKTEAEIHSVISNHRFKCGRKGGFDKGEQLAFSPEQIEWIKKHYKLNTVRMLTPLFNKRFGTSKRWQQLRAFIHSQRITSGRNGCFPSGHKPWNTGTKGATSGNSGSFKTGQMPHNHLQVGTEIIRPDGYLWVKTEEPDGWRQKHYLEWEKINGPVQDDHILFFLDQDPLNWIPENMELLTRSELVRLNKLKFKDLPTELKPAARMIAKISMMRGELNNSV